MDNTFVGLEHFQVHFIVSPPPSSSHDGVAGEIGNATEVAAVTSHQDVALLAPGLAPAVRDKNNKYINTKTDTQESPHTSPVLHDPVFPSLGVHSEADRQHGVVDIVLVAVPVVVNT